MKVQRLLLLVLACFALGLCVPLVLGWTYSDRLSTHAGFFQVSVTDPLPPPSSTGMQRPRRTVLVVFDGLGYQEAETMPALNAMQQRGQCRKTDVGPLSLSRPVYAVISTGLEQDRTGARGNDDTSPLAAQSIWDVARRAGMSVSAVSELPWWRELFPSGFSHYETLPEERNFFQAAQTPEMRADLTLIHPIYVDESGHEAGAGSARYHASVARGDAELSAFMATLDLSQDLLVVTADHGHSLSGGHGGRQDRIAHVLTCYAGVGVAHRPEIEAMRTTTIAPSLALLLGLPFPANMRAGDDDLDTLWSIADSAAFPVTYLAERRQTVERFRNENRAQLLRWLPASDGSWQRFFALHRHSQRLGMLVLVALLLLFVGHALVHRNLTPQPRFHRSGLLFAWTWMVLFVLLSYWLQVALRGSFDMSSIDIRAGFIRFTLILGALWAVGAVGIHFLVRRHLDALLLDLAAASLVGTVLSLAQPMTQGYHLGFPVPAPSVYFFPYFAALFLAALNGVGILLLLAIWYSRRRRAQKDLEGPR